MKGKRHFLFLLQLVWLTDAAWAQQQRPSYSLQAAVDELHRREAAKYPLNAPPSQQHYLGGDQDYWDEDTDSPAYTSKLRNRHKLNKALSKYLERENYERDRIDGTNLWPFGGYEFDDTDSSNRFSNYPDEKKRSTPLRERDSKYENPSTSVFRERESQVSNTPEHAELTEQFLREIEDAQEHEREERYKEAIRHLWEKYQQKENELEGDLFEEKKRIRTPPYYMLMQKKRSYPVLPWLPYSPDIKKRFPVSKRSTKRSLNDNSNIGKTEDKVAKELSELFGAPVQDKKKRSTNEQSSSSSSASASASASLVSPPLSTSTNSPNAAATTADDCEESGEKGENRTTQPAKDTTNAEGHAIDAHHQHNNHNDHSEHHDQHKSHKHHKRSGDRSHVHNPEEDESEEGEEHDHDDDHEHDHDHDHDDEHDEEHDDEHDEEFDEDDEERKKKRDVSVNKNNINKEVANPGQILHDEMMKSRRKKSIDWSKYFGLDRKKKAMKSEDDTKPQLNFKKRSAEQESYLNVRKSHDLDPEKLENMDKKLQSIEDFIISETIKYTGAHEGIANPEEIRRLKDHVLSRLATAYSLEKMRRALEKLRQSVDNENHLLRNVIQPNGRSSSSSDGIDSVDNQKRLSVKKEKAQLDGEHEHNDKNKEGNALQNLDNHGDVSSEEDDDMKKQKKKRTGYLRYPEQRNDLAILDGGDVGAINRYEPLNDAYLGNKNYIIGSNQCPLIESMAERCRGVDLLSGDINQELLPICGIHQICYLCGTLQLACDYQYLAEADSICGNNNECQSAARSVLMILRGSPGPQLGPRECLKNPCLHSAMREIGL